MFAMFSLDFSLRERLTALSASDRGAFIDEYGAPAEPGECYMGDPELALTLFGEVRLRRVLPLRELVAKLDEITRTIQGPVSE